MNDSIIKDKATLKDALIDLLNRFEQSEICAIFKEYPSDLASLSIFYCEAIEEILKFLAHKVAGSYPIAFSVSTAVCCYFFKYSKIPLFEITPCELKALKLPPDTKFGTIRQVDLCDSALQSFFNQKWSL